MMLDKELLVKTLRNTTFAVVYIFVVSQIMQNGEKLFGNADSKIFGPFAILLLFSLSAAVVGSLILGLTVILFLDDKKKESILAAIYSIGWLAVYTVIGFLILILVK